MRISLHGNTTQLSNHALYTQGWQIKKVENARDIARTILRHCNSPILWRDGHRKADNFISSEWAVLDIDGGCTIQKALEIYGEYEHVLGVTKSHQKQKGKEGPKDRFRLWIRLDGSCTNKDDFKETQRRLGKAVGADEQAYDGARKYLPCAKIVSGKVDGKRAPICRYVPPVVEKTVGLDNMRHKFIPAFIKHWLTSGSEIGRNCACFKVGLYLGRNGWTLEEINAIVSQSSLSIGLESNEMLEALRNGYRRSK